jgi:ABC-type polysaccharide/polyol phosphate export permease
MYWVIGGVRWIFLEQPIVVTPLLYISTGCVLVALLGGWLVFSLTERAIVDVQ